MKPVYTPSTNVVFKLPGGGPENNLPLEASTNGGEPDGEPVLRSTWELTDEERQWVAEGGRIELVIFGQGHPPVAMHVTDKEGNILGTWTECPTCHDKGEVPATPGYPGDGPMPCPTCHPEFHEALEARLEDQRIEERRTR